VIEEIEQDVDAESSGGRKARRRHNARRNAIEWVIVVAGALIVAVVIKTFLFQAFYIPSVSMEPTLKVGDRVLVNKLSYDLHDVNRGDIVVFERPSTDPQTIEGCDGKPVTVLPPKNTEEVHDLIKRVIAVGGDTIEVRGGHVFLNGTQLNEPYLPANTTTPPFEQSAYSTQCIKVPKGEVFVMGDNRQNSAASNRFGPIPESLIVGRAFVRVWPLGSISGI
jgi:signal peptidase I